MRKGRLQSGEPFLAIKVEHFVKAKDFAHALADYCWTKSIDFNEKMSKREAIGILKNGLFFNGLHGEFDTEQFEGADPSVYDEWAIPYNKAKEWVLKNYPYLKGKEVGNG